MASLNKTFIIGRLGQDPEARYTAQGTAVTTFSVATSEKYKDKERTEWHNIVAWNKLAEIAREYLKKGSMVYLEGKIQSREYQGRDGSTRKAFEIVATSLVMLGGGGKSEVKKTVEGYRDEFNKNDDFIPEPPEEDDVPL